MPNSDICECPSRLDVAKSCAKAMHPCIKKFVNLHTMLAMGLIAFVVHSSIVVYFLYTSFTAKLATKFLSLDSAAGVCSSITISQGEAHGIDKNGNWDVEPTYLSQESLYNVEFTEYQGNTSSWNSDMDALYSTMNTELDYLRSISDLPSKVLHLSSWRKTINATKSGSLFLKFNADPSFILDNPGNSLSVIFGPTSSSCPKDFDFWNLKDGILTVNYDVQFNNSGVPEQFCSNDDDFNMFDCGYDSGSVFNLEVDLHSSVTVAALNAEVINSSDLADMTTMSYIYHQYDDANWADADVFVNYTLSFDPEFPDMAVLYASNSGQHNAQNYLQRIGDTLWDVDFSGFAYSWFGPNGDNWLDPTYTGPYYCPNACSSGADNPCSMPDFVFKYTQQGTNRTFKIRLEGTEISTINEGKMDPGFIGCATSSSGSGGDLGLLEPTSAATFQTHLKHAPFRLEEDYFQCTSDPATAFFDSLGVAMGNAALFFTIFMLTVMYLAGRAGYVDTSVSDDDIAADCKTFVQALRFSAQNEQNLMSDKHRKLQEALQAFYTADLSSASTSMNNPMVETELKTRIDVA